MLSGLAFELCIFNAKIIKRHRWLDEQGVQHFSTEGDAKASVVERFNRTLKERLYRYFTAANTLKFDDVLPELVQGYNATRHRSIGMAPQDVTRDNEEAVWKRLYGKRLKDQKKPKFKVGDRVRLNKIHRTFAKGYLPGWTEEVFVVHRVVPGPVTTYKIREWDDTPVQGTFYAEDLQKVHVSDVFRIEKVLKSHFLRISRIERHSQKIEFFFILPKHPFG